MSSESPPENSDPSLPGDTSPETRASAPRRSRLTLEPLENRLLLSADPLMGLGAHALQRPDEPAPHVLRLEDSGLSAAPTSGADRFQIEHPDATRHTPSDSEAQDSPAIAWGDASETAAEDDSNAPTWVTVEDDDLLASDSVPLGAEPELGHPAPADRATSGRVRTTTSNRRP